MKLKNLGSTLLTGAFAQWGPNIVKGAMKEYLHLLSPRDFAKVVQSDQKIFDSLDPEHQRMVLKAMSKLGDLSWLTKEWVMENGRETAPAIHSMLMSWPEAQDWLERNIEDLKQRGGNQ